MTIKENFVPFNKRKLAFIDTETTGLFPEEHEIIEIAVMIYDQEKDQVVKKWSKKAAPRHIQTANPIALDMNGYNEDPESYMDNIEEVLKEYYDIVEGCMIVGQNVQFDIDFIDKYRLEFNIGKEIHRDGKLELKSMVWFAVKDSDVKSRSLAPLCNYFNISNEGEHRALIDCKRTLEVYRCLIKIYNSNKMD